MKRLSFLLFLTVFFLLRPYQMQNSAMMYAGDDYSYFAHTSALVTLSYPNYSREVFQTGGDLPIHSIGSSLMALPFTATFSLVDRVVNPSFFEQRSNENIKKSWTLYGFVLASIFYFILGTCLLYLVIKGRHCTLTALWSTSLMVLAQGLPLYAFRRPLFSHSFEFFLFSLMIFYWFTVKDKIVNKNNKWFCLQLALISGLTILVRENNAILAMLFPALMLYNENTAKKEYLRVLFSTYMVSIFIVVLFKFYPNLSSSGETYYSNLEVRSRLLNIHTLSFYLRRIWHVLFGLDWGIIFTAPFMLAGLFWVFIKRQMYSKQYLFFLIPLLLNFIIIIQWCTQGSWYGYRYLIAAGFPLLIVPFSDFINCLFKQKKKSLLFLMALIAIIPLGSMLFFEGNNSNLTLSVVEQYFGLSGWGNNSYQIEIFKELFSNPFKSVIILFKGGVLYFVYLLAELLNKAHVLPSQLTDKYDYLSLVILFRTMFIYVVVIFCPILFAWIYRRSVAEDEIGNTDTLL